MVNEVQKNPYNMSTTPKNSWELFKWMFSEPIKLKNFSDSLSNKETVIWYLKLTPWIVLISSLLFVLSNFAVAYWDLPTHYPQYFQEDIAKWQNVSSTYNKFFYLVDTRFFLFIKSIGLGLAFSFFLGPPSSFVAGLGFGVAGGVAWGLAFAMVFALILLIASLPEELVHEDQQFKDQIANTINFFSVVLTMGIMVGIGLGVKSGFAVGFAVFLGFFVVALFVFFGLHTYLYHFIKYQIVSPTLSNNPYLNDSNVFFPIFRIQKALEESAFVAPKDAKHFTRFLFEFRPLQRDLAFYLSNIIHASYMFRYPLDSTIDIPKDYEKHQPTESFTDHLTQYKNELNTYRTQNNLQFQKESLETIIKTLKRLEEDMIKETRGWKVYYLKAIRQNLEVAHSEFKNLELKLSSHEPIQTNVYRVGHPLSPSDKTNTFKGRIDLKDTLSRIIYTAVAMPLLFIQGQRRVGKTSLINYLEVLLGSGFKIIKVDMQQGINEEFHDLLENLNKKINEKLSIEEIVAFEKDNIRANWMAFEEYLIKHTQRLNYKLIIAFDEYENFHTNIAQSNPKILQYMRGFLQNQEKVVFLFTGLKDISELTNPNWDEYFPQIQKLRVDYLSVEDSKELITHPVPEFRLVYDESIVEDIVALTQGHPQLLQTIGSIVVDLANAKGIKNITQTLFEEAKAKIFQTNEAPMSIFWREYCDDTQRAIIEQILEGKPITQETQEQKRALLRLKEYGFITDSNTIRVPLFEKWLIERRALIEIGAKS